MILNTTTERQKDVDAGYLGVEFGSGTLHSIKVNLPLQGLYVFDDGNLVVAVGPTSRLVPINVTSKKVQVVFFVLEPMKTEVSSVRGTHVDVEGSGLNLSLVGLGAPCTLPGFVVDWTGDAEQAEPTFRALGI